MENLSSRPSDFKRSADFSMGAMASRWNELAGSSRWRGVVSFIRNWVGAFGPDQGMLPRELDAILRAKTLNLPVAVCEWYLLAANWTPKGMNVWIHPRELMAYDGRVDVLHDKDGVNEWSIRIADLQQEDPPVVADDKIASPSFSKFVAAMIINDVLFDYETEEPVELKRAAACVEGMRIVASCFGDFVADGPLESAAVMLFAYPRNGPLLEAVAKPI